MREAGSPSWRFVEDEAQFLHLALFMRDATELAIARSDDIPPRLAAELGIPIGDVDAATYVLDVEARGRTWLRRASRCALLRWPLTRKPHASCCTTSSPPGGAIRHSHGERPASLASVRRGRARGAAAVTARQPPREVHLHLHGVSAEDIAAILARQSGHDYE